MSVFFGEKSPETHSEVCPQTLTLAHNGECFYWVSREGERRKDRAVGETPFPQEAHTLVSKQERQEGPTHGMWGRDCALMEVLGRLPPNAFLILSAELGQVPTRRHMEDRTPQRGRGPSAPCPHPISPATPHTGALTQG